LTCRFSVFLSGKQRLKGKVFIFGKFLLVRRLSSSWERGKLKKMGNQRSLMARVDRRWCRICSARPSLLRTPARMEGSLSLAVLLKTVSLHW